MKIIALEEHFITPREEHDLPPGAQRGNDREKLLGFDVVAALLDLGETRLAAMDAAGIDVQVLSHNQPGCQALDAAAAIPAAREANDLLSEAVKVASPASPRCRRQILPPRSGSSSARSRGSASRAR
jgi:predicted TIM-barrel fold metal-dependent hydrolase